MAVGNNNKLAISLWKRLHDERGSSAAMCEDAVTKRDYYLTGEPIQSGDTIRLVRVKVMGSPQQMNPEASRENQKRHQAKELVQAGELAFVAV